MRAIELTGGKVTVVDDEDFEELAQYQWRISNSGYVMRMIPRSKPRKCVLMHREICKPDKGLEVDHINLDKLDNRRSNLRLVSHSQNCCNRPKKSYNKLGEKCISISKDKKAKRFAVRVNSGGKVRYSKRFATLEEAKLARDLAIQQYHGEFGRLS